MIHSLFPTPVYENNLPRQFTKQEIEYVLECQKFYTINYGNTTSSNNYVLDEDPMIDIKNFIMFCVREYMANIVDPSFDVDIRITQSWFNYTNPGQFHHKHSHPNSFISGVFYFQADPTKDKIVFYNPQQTYMYNLNVPGKNIGELNSESTWLSNKPGKLVIFPSKLEHSVSVTESHDTRISLAFNTFLIGDIGDERSLTGLRL